MGYGRWAAQPRKTRRPAKTFAFWANRAPGPLFLGLENKAPLAIKESTDKPNQVSQPPQHNIKFDLLGGPGERIKPVDEKKGFPALHPFSATLMHDPPAEKAISHEQKSPA
ncbi:MAG: hypothetical protein WAT67_07825 [Candidatus Contendobacter sp.]